MMVAIASVAPVQLRCSHGSLDVKIPDATGTSAPGQPRTRRGRVKAGPPPTRVAVMADTSTTVQKVSAETLGTFVLVFFGCGSVVFSSNIIGGSDYTAVGLTFGLSVML